VVLRPHRPQEGSPARTITSATCYTELAPHQISEAVPRPSEKILFRSRMDALTDGRLEK